MIRTFAPLLLAITLIGCSAPEDVVTPPATPNEKVTFAGEIDSTLAGEWANTNGRSTMVLAPDGTSTVEANVVTRAGNQMAGGKGRWRVDGSHLIMEGESGVTRQHLKRVDPNTIELRAREESKIVQTFRRKAKKS